MAKFPEMMVIHDKLFQAFNSSCQDTMDSLLKLSKRKLKLFVKKQKIQKGKNFIKVLKPSILHLFMRISDDNRVIINDSQKTTFLKLLSCLVDFYLFLSQSDKIYVEFAAQDVSIYSSGKSNDISLILLQSIFIKKKYSKICCPLLKRFLHIIPHFPLHLKVFMRYIFLFRMWIQCSSKRAKIMSLASQLKLRSIKTNNDQFLILTFGDLFSAYEITPFDECLFTPSFYKYWLTKKFPLGFLRDIKKILCEPENINVQKEIDHSSDDIGNINNRNNNNEPEGCIEFKSQTFSCNEHYDDSNITPTSNAIDFKESDSIFFIDTEGQNFTKHNENFIQVISVDGKERDTNNYGKKKDAETTKIKNILTNEIQNTNLVEFSCNDKVSNEEHVMAYNSRSNDSNLNKLNLTKSQTSIFSNDEPENIDVQKELDHSSDNIDNVNNNNNESKECIQSKNKTLSCDEYDDNSITPTSNTNDFKESDNIFVVDTKGQIFTKNNDNFIQMISVDGKERDMNNYGKKKDAETTKIKNILTNEIQNTNLVEFLYNDQVSNEEHIMAHNSCSNDSNLNKLNLTKSERSIFSDSTIEDQVIDDSVIVKNQVTNDISNNSSLSFNTLLDSVNEKISKIVADDSTTSIDMPLLNLESSDEESNIDCDSNKQPISPLKKSDEVTNLKTVSCSNISVPQKVPNDNHIVSEVQVQETSSPNKISNVGNIIASIDNETTSSFAVVIPTPKKKENINLIFNIISTSNIDSNIDLKKESYLAENNIIESKPNFTSLNNSLNEISEENSVSGIEQVTSLDQIFSNSEQSSPKKPSDNLVSMDSFRSTIDDYPALPLTNDSNNDSINELNLKKVDDFDSVQIIKSDDHCPAKVDKMQINETLQPNLNFDKNSILQTDTTKIDSPNTITLRNRKILQKSENLIEEKSLNNEDDGIFHSLSSDSETSSPKKTINKRTMLLQKQVVKSDASQETSITSQKNILSVESLECSKITQPLRRSARKRKNSEDEVSQSESENESKRKVKKKLVLSANLTKIPENTPSNSSSSITDEPSECEKTIQPLRRSPRKNLQVEVLQNEDERERKLDLPIKSIKSLENMPSKSVTSDENSESYKMTQPLRKSARTQSESEDESKRKTKRKFVSSTNLTKSLENSPSKSNSVIGGGDSCCSNMPPLRRSTRQRKSSLSESEDESKRNLPKKNLSVNLAKIPECKTPSTGANCDPCCSKISLPRRSTRQRNASISDSEDESKKKFQKKNTSSVNLAKIPECETPPTNYSTDANSYNLRTRKETTKSCCKGASCISHYMNKLDSLE